MNQEHNITTPKASLLLMEQDLCKRDHHQSLVSRSSSVGGSSRASYYYHHRSIDEGVPFKWEIQPGTPINNPPPEDIVRPITPPPAFFSLGLPKPSVVRGSDKHSLIPANLKFWRWRNLRKKCLSRWSSQSMLTKGNNNAIDGKSNSCDELRRFEEFKDYRSSSSSSSSTSSSSKDHRLMKISPRWFSGWPSRNSRKNHSDLR